MHTLLFIFYCLVSGFAVCRLRFIRDSGIRPSLLLGLFALHVLTGLAHNIIAYRYYPEHGDIWDYFWKSYLFRHRFLTDFHTFLENNDTWTYITHNGMIFIQMILNVFSNDHLDTNTLLFAFPVFLGNIALFRTFRHRFPDDPLTCFAVFLLPSVLFWTSCIHREGILYMLLGFLLLGFHRMMTGAFTTGRLLRTSLCFAGIVYFRIGFALTLLPALFTWCYLEKPPLRPLLLKIAAATAAIGILLSLTVLHLPQTLAAWQKEFYDLQGHSRLTLPALDGSWASLFRTLPAAALNGFFEPLPGSGGQPIYLAFSIELLLIWTLAAVALFLKIRTPVNPSAAPKIPPTPSATPHPTSPFSIFCILFALSGMLLIGIFVPFAGTIIRYRSIFLLFLLAPSLHALNQTPPLRFLNNWITQHALYKLKKF